MDLRPYLPLPSLIRALLLGCALALILTGASAPAVAGDRAGGDYRAGELIVKTDPLATSSVASVLSRYGLAVRRRISPLNLYVVDVPPGQERAFISLLERDPAVRYVELNYLVRPSAGLGVIQPLRGPAWPGFGLSDVGPLAAANDTAYPEQWNLPRILAPTAWDLTTGSAVTIAILGTGIDLDHPDLQGKIVAGYDVINDDDDPRDDNGYYTFVAGIAAAVTNNWEGIAGVSWGARLMPVKVMGADGIGSYADIVEGVRWAADHGANIINMSFVGSSSSKALQDAMDYALSQGVKLLVASTGDYAADGHPVVYPAALRNVLAVTGSDKGNVRLRTSGFGDYVDLTAPAENIISTYWQPGQHLYAMGPGTDFAAPHVAGVAALVLSVNPSLSLNQLTQVLQSTATDLGNPGYDYYYGYGLVDTAKAVRAAAHFLQVSPERLMFQDDGVRVEPASQRITNHTTSALTWSAVPSADWIQVSGPNGYTPSYVDVSVQRGKDLGCGIRPGRVSVASLMPTSVNSPKLIDVILRFSASCPRTYLPLVIKGR